MFSSGTWDVIGVILALAVVIYVIGFLLKLLIRHVFYTATKAIEDAKTDVKKMGTGRSMPPPSSNQIEPPISSNHTRAINPYCCSIDIILKCKRGS